MKRKTVLIVALSVIILSALWLIASKILIIPELLEGIEYYKRNISEAYFFLYYYFYNLFSLIKCFVYVCIGAIIIVISILSMKYMSANSFVQKKKVIISLLLVLLSLLFIKTIFEVLTAFKYIEIVIPESDFTIKLEYISQLFVGIIYLALIILCIVCLLPKPSEEQIEEQRQKLLKKKEDKIQKLQKKLEKLQGITEETQKE